MNFCADLKSLVTISFSGSQLDPWNQLLKHLQSIISNDVSPYFVAPVVLALTVLCSGGNLPSEIKGPAPRTDRPKLDRSYGHVLLRRSCNELHNDIVTLTFNARLTIA